jgi:hypothetical protein
MKAGMWQMRTNLYKGGTRRFTTINTAICRNGGANSGAKDGDGTTELEKGYERNNMKVE